MIHSELRTRTEHLENFALIFSDLQPLINYIQLHNVIGAALFVKGTPLVRNVVPFIDMSNGYIYKLELRVGQRNVTKNFETRFLSPGKTMKQEIIDWLKTPAVPRDTLQKKTTKIGTPADPFYHSLLASS